MKRNYMNADRVIVLVLLLFVNIYLDIATYYKFSTEIKSMIFPIAFILFAVIFLSKIRMNEKLNDNFFTRYYENYGFFWGCLLIGIIKLRYIYRRELVFPLFLIFIGVIGPFIFNKFIKR